MRSDILTVKLYPYFMTGTLKNLIMWENHLDQIYLGSAESTLTSTYKYLRYAGTIEECRAEAKHLNRQEFSDG